jgi:hydroxyacylglutathione hydrolase
MPYLTGRKKKKRKLIFVVLFALMAIFMKKEKYSVDIKLKDGDKIGELKVVHVPGHTEGSICLFEKDKTFFSGDAVVTGPAGEIRGFIERFTADTAEAGRSLKKISGLKFGILLSEHGKPVLKNASEKVKIYFKKSV